VWKLGYTELRQPELLATRQCRLTVECHGAGTVKAAPRHIFGLEILVQQVRGGVKLSPGSQIEIMEQTVEFMAEQRGEVSGIPELLTF
jgi:hypothetical protein